MVNILFNKLGRITKGEETGHFIKLIDDRKGDTGGFYAFITKDLTDDSPVYDSWFESIDGIQDYVDECEIEWYENMESIKLQVH